MKSLRSITGSLTPIHLLTPFVFLLLTSSPLVQHRTASAQASYNPVTVSAPAFARTQTKLYILGGATSDGIALSQFMYLDLSVGWTTAAPAWTRLADGPPQFIFPAAFTSDEQTMFVFHLIGSNKPQQYNVQTNAWSVTNYTFSNMAQTGVSVVTDPNTGLMYLAGGYSSLNFDNTTMTFSKLDTFDPLTLSVRQTDVPTSTDVFPARLYYGNVWSQAKSAVLYFGGNNPNNYTSPQPLENVVSAFAPATMSFFILNTGGTAPPMRSDHCMAANEDGSKVLIYGGRLRSNTVGSDVFVLDVIGQTWTQGVSSYQSRMYTACTVVGDQLLIWGGAASVFGITVAPAEILIYDYVKRIWTTQYTPPKPTPNSNTVAIIAGVVSGLALVAAVVGIFFFRRRRSRRKDRRLLGDASSDDPEEAKSHAIAAASLGSGSGSRNHDNQAKDPMESSEEYELERTLMDLEEQKRELEKKQQLLVLQHRADNPEHDLQDAVAKVHKRGPMAYVEPDAEYIPVQPPTYPDHQQHQQGVLSPRTSNTAGTTFSDRGSAWSPPTAAVRVVSPTYAATSPLSASSYISPSSIVRTSTKGDIQGGLVQMESEPLYELTPGFVPGTPDLVYEQMTGSGRQWARKAQGPQIVMDPEDGTVRIPRSPATIPLP
ncbi:hypothetical protein KI688_007684 [Linnemannia hyalina]|uniref:Galactose oxidase n=1 Tax=Linnemannia hyalina TaxID=64524 RepID=A0A9P7XGT2_9FUNG|nr:hypothetical protein KI688_007684 [Linnemannia hyalina]